MENSKELENKAEKPAATKSEKELERERFQANRDRKLPEKSKPSAFGSGDPCDGC